jgi:hypothetical protein
VARVSMRCALVVKLGQGCSSTHPTLKPLLRTAEYADPLALVSVVGRKGLEEGLRLEGVLVTVDW